ncbi:TPA: hypothetical protein J5U00_004379 [Escherichia coli]|nr:hypothetical protein [Escherichia coli]
MLNLFVGLDIYTGLLLLLALAFVLFYEAINGFHDTANAVATVIYTRAMQPQLAVVMAAFFNFFGVLLGGLSVAYAIVHMLPTDLLLNMGSTHGLAMVFSMLLAAIIWNLGTWFFGLPASSSHTLIGAIIGIGLTNALLTGSSVMDALNLREVTKIFSSLIVSPIVGLVIAGGLIFLLRRFWSGTKKRDRIHRIPEDRKKKKGKRKPPFWTRIALIVSAAGVTLWSVSEQVAQSRDQAEKQFLTLFPEQKRIVNLRSQVTMALKKYRPQAEDTRLLAELSAIASTLKSASLSDIEMCGFTFDQKRQTLHLQLRAANFASFDKLRSALATDYVVQQDALQKEGDAVSGGVMLRRK